MTTTAMILSDEDFATRRYLFRKEMLLALVATVQDMQKEIQGERMRHSPERGMYMRHLSVLVRSEPKGLYKHFVENEDLSDLDLNLFAFREIFPHFVLKDLVQHGVTTLQTYSAMPAHMVERIFSGHNEKIPYILERLHANMNSIELMQGLKGSYARLSENL